MKPKISLITLGVKDIEKSLSFYRDGLGFEAHEYKEGDDHVMFKMESSWLGLFPLDKLAEGAKVPADKGSFSGIVFAHNVVSEDEVNRVFQIAISAGATKLKEPVKVFWGGYESHFADPDGYVWAVTYNPFTDLS
jgi:catechol 2,3-dioxygenase-like lactoylglutathione lyase family enzyme